MLTLVTGATGLVGNNVVRLLLERGEQVRVLCRSDGGKALAGLDVEISRGDVRQADAVQAGCRGASQIIHAAADVRIGWTGLDEARQTNVEGTRNVAAAARAEGARLVYVSTVNAMACGTRAAPANEDTPLGPCVRCPYVVTKREAERVVLDEVARGLDAVIVNPVFMLGPWDWRPSSGKMLLEVATGWAKRAPPGGNDFCDVRDVAAGIIAALDRGQTGRLYILGGEPMSFLEAWTLLARITRVKPPTRNMYPHGLWIWGHGGDVWGKLTGREPALNSAAVAMARHEHHYSYARARDELGYHPRPAAEAAEAAWAWFREHGYA